MLSHKLRIGLLASSLNVALTLGVLGCHTPRQDDFRNEGGISPDPTGVIEGSIVYIGPKPQCAYQDGRATRVRGRVILTMFAYDNPPPPEGRATTAENLFVLAGEELFDISDCMPEGAPADLSQPVTRSAPFRWPGIALHDAAHDVQVRGFYDYDEDMNPFFGVKKLPTAGDIAGAALENLQNAAQGFLRITLPAQHDARDGYQRQGVTVALGNYVWTERPAFKLSAERSLSAQAPIPIKIDVVAKAADVPGTLRNIWNLTCPDGSDCGLSLVGLQKDEVEKTFTVAGVQQDFDRKRSFFYVSDVNVRTVNLGGPDVAGPDKEADPHPLLGASLGVPWKFPIVIMSRLPLSSEQAALEAKARIPSVTLVGSPLLDEIAQKQVFADQVHIAVPPIAVVDLDPTNSLCRVPYVPPGNYTSSYEDRVANCADMPTGVFGVSVLAGVAGGRLVTQPDTAISDTGVTVEGGSYSGQSWSVPNELAEPVQVGEANVLESQGAKGLFIVHDPEPDTTGDCSTAIDPVLLAINLTNPDKAKREVMPRGLCEAGQSPLLENPKGVDGTACLPSACCDGIKHLCGLPLCPVVDQGGLQIRRGPSKLSEKNGVSIPDCVPFAMPSLCCQ